jgi:hypothetical protein
LSSRRRRARSCGVISGSRTEVHARL